MEFAESKILFIDDLGSEPVRCMTYGMAYILAVIGVSRFEK